MVKKISSKEFHEIFCGIVSAGECIGYGPERQKAFEHGWSEAMNRVYARLVDTSLDGALDEDGQATAAYAEAHEEALCN